VSLPGGLAGGAGGWSTLGVAMRNPLRTSCRTSAVGEPVRPGRIAIAAAEELAHDFGNGPGSEVVVVIPARSELARHARGGQTESVPLRQPQYQSSERAPPWAVDRNEGPARHVREQRRANGQRTGQVV